MARLRHPMIRRTATFIMALVVLAACNGDSGQPEASSTAPDTTGAPDSTVGVSTSVTSEPSDGTTGSTTATTVAPAAGPRLEPVTDALAVPRSLADLGDGRVLIADQRGSIHVLVDGEVLPKPFLDISERVVGPSASSPEPGLTGLVVSPTFADDGRVFTFYAAVPAEDAGPTIGRVDTLSEWTVSPDALNTADPDSERVLLAIERPGVTHIGGDLAFDDAGMLYLGLGVLTGDVDAQDPTTLPGSVIRIDVNGGDPYGIPPDNPFVDGGGAPEVYSYGFRNPWRFSWDDEWGLLFSEPMFTAKHQELEIAAAGGNFGYPLLVNRIGGSCYQAGEPVPGCLNDDSAGPLLAPVLDYGRDVGDIISGAIAYRGTAVPELEGKVLVTDWEGTMLAATPGPTGPWAFEELEVAPPNLPFAALLWAIDTDAAGEVYVMMVSQGFTDGVVFRLVSG